MERNRDLKPKSALTWRKADDGYVPRFQAFAWLVRNSVSTAKPTVSPLTL
jgi:hypothetical protein